MVSSNGVVASMPAGRSSQEVLSTAGAAKTFGKTVMDIGFDLRDSKVRIGVESTPTFLSQV